MIGMLKNKLKPLAIFVMAFIGQLSDAKTISVLEKHPKVLQRR